MAGRITKSEEQLKPDPKYADKVLSKFVNCFMKDGKKAVALRVMYDALDRIDTRLKKEKNTDEDAPKKAIDVFHKALENVRPNVEVRSKRVGGANYQVPMPVNARRRQSLTFRWIITACRAEKGKPFAQCLAKELWDAAKGEGKAVTTREQTHRMAEANQGIFTLCLLIGLFKVWQFLIAITANGSSMASAIRVSLQFQMRQSPLLGVGALGCMSGSMLARAGVGHLVLIDRDIVEKTNLQRQVLFTEEDANLQLPKAAAAAENLAKVNSEIKITSHVEDLTSRNIHHLLEGVDVIVDGLDNFNTRYLLNDFAVKTNTPFMFAGVIASQGNAMTIIPGSTPCLRCLFPEPPPVGEQDSCDTVGVLAPAIGIAASCQCMDAIKYVTGNQELISRTLLTFDLWNSESNRLGLGEPVAQCTCCQQLQFDFLNATSIEPTVLCGRLAVSLPCIENFDLQSTSIKLQEHGTFVCSETMIRGEFNEEESADGSAIQLLCFHNGRAIIHGTDDIRRAKAIFERYVGN